MKVLITGGAGFIGSHLTDTLLAAGHHVRVLDNLSTGRRENLPDDNAMEFVQGDIRDPAVVNSTVQDMDAIVHLAAVASVQASIDDPLGTHATNFDGTLHLLEAARRARVRRFLYASSAAVYGNSDVSPLAEPATPRPLSPYAADKLAGEHYLAFYRSRYGLATTAFRFFSIFGPRQDSSSAYSSVISAFIDCSLRGEPVTIFGDGRQTRDFVYVADLVRLLQRALAEPAAVGQVINVGRGQQSSLLDLLAVLERLTERSVARRHLPARIGDVIHSRADTNRLRHLLGAVPETDLTTGLRRVLRSRNV